MRRGIIGSSQQQLAWSRHRYRLSVFPSSSSFIPRGLPPCATITSSATASSAVPTPIFKPITTTRHTSGITPSQRRVDWSTQQQNPSAPHLSPGRAPPRNSASPPQPRAPSPSGRPHRLPRSDNTTRPEGLEHAASHFRWSRPALDRGSDRGVKPIQDDGFVRLVNGNRNVAQSSSRPSITPAQTDKRSDPGALPPATFASMTADLSMFDLPDGNSVQPEVINDSNSVTSRHDVWSTRQASRQRDLDKRLRSALKPKHTVALSSAALAKKANKATDMADKLREKRIRGDKIKKQRELAVPVVMSVGQLAQLTSRRLRQLQALMQSMGHQDVRPDRILSADDASLIVLECGYEPLVDDSLAFDLYPSSQVTEPAAHAQWAPRPPVVCIMGHVDHGKTTLLDALRSTAIASGEAGGITQHIGAFEVVVSDLQPLRQSGTVTLATGASTITFLDTPGHAAFSEMRSRGINVTDVVVLVVAADDGVKPQTLEVIRLIKQSDVGLVVAITKCDKPGVDLIRVRNELFAAGIEVEAIGGEVPCVEVSAVSRTGLDALIETLAAVAEVRDLRAPQDAPVEARVIESDVSRERGNVASLVVLRGTLSPGAHLVAGHAVARVKQLFGSSGGSVMQALPGQPVQITGWKSLPEAGSLALEAASEDEAKRVVENRARRHEQQILLTELDAINEKRAQAKEEHDTHRSEIRGLSSRERKTHLWEREKGAKERADRSVAVKELRLVVKGDYMGTVEALVGALSPLGNAEVRTKIVHHGVGEVSEGDVNMAAAVNGSIVGFNVQVSRAALPGINSNGLRCTTDTVIYRIIDTIRDQLIEMLPKQFEDRIIGEANISQVFNVTIKGRHTRRVAGCRVGNGEIRKASKVRVVRGLEAIWQGDLEQLKHGKKDVDTISKGSECGMAFTEFQGFEVGDRVLAIEAVEVKRTL